MTDDQIPAPPDVLVVGGGIGGLATAFALTRSGLTVRVLEQAPEFGEVGAGIQLAPNCTRILDDFGMLEEVVSLGVLPRTMVMRDAVDGSELTCGVWSPEDPDAPLVLAVHGITAHHRC